MNDFQSWSALLADVVETTAALVVAVVVGTVVRRNRPDAYRALLAWSIGAVLATAGVAVGYRVVLASAARSSIETILPLLGGISLVRAAASFVLTLVLVRGLVAIAQPPKPFKVESDAPYR